MAIICGFIYFYHLDIDIRKYIKGILIIKNFKYFNIYFHMLCLLILLGLSFFMGYILNYLYLYFEFFSIGFSLASFIYTFSFKGIGAWMWFNLKYKGIFLVLFLVYMFFLNKNNKYFIKYLVNHQKQYQKLMLSSFLFSVVIYLTIIINDIILTILYN